MRSIVAFGNSHIWPFIRGYRLLNTGIKTPYVLHALDFRSAHFIPNISYDGEKTVLNPHFVEGVRTALLDLKPHYIVTTALGSDHWLAGMTKDARPYDFLVPELPSHGKAPDCELIPYGLFSTLIRGHLDWQFEFIRMLLTWTDIPIFHLEAPPPVESESLMLKSLYGHFREEAEKLGTPTASHRLKQWWVWTRNSKEICQELGIQFIEAPSETRDSNGFLRDEYYLDGIHGSDEYGALVAGALLKKIDSMNGGGPQP